MCLFYVALTRAKRGLYVLLEPPSEKADPGKPSLANWLARAVESDGAPGTVYQSGTPDWVDTVSLIEKPPSAAAGPPVLGGAVPRRQRMRPSGEPGGSHGDGARKPRAATSGMRFGTAVHAAFEQVGWLDDGPVDLPDDDAGRLVADLITVPEIRALLTSNRGNVELHREQPVDAVLDGKWLSGIIDRLHLHHDPDGRVGRIEVLDFKTDAVERENELLERHGPQMRAYRDALARAWPEAAIRCTLVSTRLRKPVIAC
jgi:ATP-dependent exoDNAse (exonuclease V) beta subunit